VHVDTSSKYLSLQPQFVPLRGPEMQLVQSVELVQFTQGDEHAVHVKLSPK